MSLHEVYIFTRSQSKWPGLPDPKLGLWNHAILLLGEPSLLHSYYRSHAPFSPCCHPFLQCSGSPSGTHQPHRLDTPPACRSEAWVLKQGFPQNCLCSLSECHPQHLSQAGQSSTYLKKTAAGWWVCAWLRIGWSWLPCYSSCITLGESCPHPGFLNSRLLNPLHLPKENPWQGKRSPMWLENSLDKVHALNFLLSPISSLIKMENFAGLSDHLQSSQSMGLPHTLLHLLPSPLWVHPVFLSVSIPLQTCGTEMLPMIM